jgi:multidrug efflux pump
VVSLTVSLIAVFIPLLFMQGVVGRLFREFALTLTIAVVVSLFVSLTLTPMMTGYLMRPHGEDKPSAVSRWAERGFDWLRDRYASSLRWTLRHEALMLLLATATVAGTIALYILVPKGFLPAQDTGLIAITMEAPQDASFRRVSELQQDVTRIVRTDPAVVSTTSVAGAGPINPAQNTGRLTAVLLPRDARDVSAQQIAARLQPKLEAVPGILVHLQPVQDIQIGARVSATQFQYTLMDPDPAELSEWSGRLLARLRQAPELRDLTTDLREGGLRVTVQVDRERMSRLGVTMQAVDDVLYDAFGQRQISTIYGQSNQYRVVLETTPAMRDDPALVALLRVPGANGVQVPLGEIAEIGRRSGPLTVNRQDQFPAVTIGFDLPEGGSLGNAVAAIQRAEAQLGMPEAITGEFSGDAAEFNRSLAGTPYLILAAVVVIYIVLGMLYESVIHPLTILSTLPSAGIGALLALWLCGLDLSVVGIIGIVLLMGIVKKNAIMMIDFALEAQRDHGRTPDEAIYEASVLRFRPIMMTTMAALLGAVPLVIGNGPGSELRLPLGVSVIGGLLLSQVITLYTTPAIYLALERLRARLSRREVVAAE